MIGPLFGGRSAIEVLAAILAGVTEDTQWTKQPEELVRQTFRKMAGDDVKMQLGIW